MGDRLGAWVSYESSLDKGVLPQIIVSVLGRTSGPALTYPVVFPTLHGFYGPDLALDVVCSKKLGCTGRSMPDDNLVVWDQMYPHNPGGSITAPFQFALYSQAGLPSALLGSVLLGAALAVVWRTVRARSLRGPWSELLGAITILAAVNLALDSPRNGLLVSYGALWGVAFVVFLAAASRRMQRLRVRPARQTERLAEPNSPRATRPYDLPR